MPTPTPQLPPLETALAERLRCEVDHMTAAYVEALLALLPAGSVTAIYAKGSAYKPWDSIIDYVPEVSDVDLHVRLAEHVDRARLDASLDFVLRLSERALAAFTERVPEALHVPRPQLLWLNALEQLPGFLGTPAQCVHTLHGTPYAAPSRDDYRATQRDDAERFAADARYVELELAGKVIDRPGHHAWRAISLMAWRVAPTGPRLLTHLGLHPYDAWSLNRTGVVRELLARDQHTLADAYTGFYRACWEGFRSEFRGSDAARVALRAVEHLFAQGTRLLGERRAGD